MESALVLAQDAPPLNRMLWLLFILAMVGVLGITALLVMSAVRRSRTRREQAERGAQERPRVDAWQEAGRRAEPVDEDEMHPASDRYEDVEDEDDDDDWEDDDGDDEDIDDESRA